MKMRSHKAGLFLTALLTGTAFTVPAIAQTEDQVPAASDSNDAVEIIVTARKRDERVIDVPTSITALGAEELSRYASSNVESIGALVPQVSITHNPSGSGAIVTIRGIGTNNTGDDGVEQAVSFNIDGVPTSRGRILQSAMFDLSNVQVLKGPQALYFGKNSPGGVLIAESKGPTDSLSGYARAAYEFKAKEVIGEAAIGGPISDSLGFRIAIRGSDMSGGYVRNVSTPILAANSPVAADRINGINLPGATYKWGPETKQYAGRLTLAFDDGGPFKATFKAFGSHYKTNGETSQVLQLSCPAGFPNGAVRDIGAFAFPAASLALLGLTGTVQDPTGECNPRKRVNSLGSLPANLADFANSNGGTPYSKTNNYLAALDLEYQAGDVTFTSISGYYKFTNRNLSNFDYTTFALVHGTSLSTNESLTQEVRAVSSFDGPLNFSIGAFYEHADRVYNNENTILRAVFSGTNNSMSTRTNTSTDSEAFSVVGELTFKPAPNVEISGGARYTHEEKTSLLTTTFRQIGLASALGVYGPAGRTINAKFKTENVSPQVTVSWRPSENANVFVGYRTGYKSGGIASPAFLAPSATPTNLVFDDETVKGVEGGFKFQSDDRKLRGDITLYHYKYKGLQVSTFDSVTNTLRIQNAGGAKVQGVEASLDYAANSDLSLHGAVGYNRARFTTFANSACYGGQVAATGCVANRQDLTGRQLPRAPNFTGNVGAVWDSEISTGYRLGATIDGRYSSGYNYNANLSPFAFQKSYFTIDGSIRLHDAEDRWELALIGKNLTNKFYATFGTDRPLGVSPGSLTGVVGLPRTVQLQGTFNF
jgi:iron complex outermembrane receptor protein